MVATKGRTKRKAEEEKEKGEKDRREQEVCGSK
jgi:hypothetical protein